jgi:DNA-binding XRE family transcriptional regulator
MENKEWNNIKNDLSSLTEIEKEEIELVTDVIVQMINQRNELGISQRELGSVTGINQAAICRIETMKNIPQLDTLIKLMKPLGLKITVSKS